MKVEIQNLQDGTTRFEFVAEAKGVDFPDRRISFKDIAIESIVDKGDENIVVTNNVGADTIAECESCLAEYSGRFEEQYILIYTSNRDTVDNDDEEVLRYLSKTTRDLDLAEGLFEALQLALPMRLLCRENCKGLCSTCGTNLNEKQCDCKPDHIDPRWEGLKKLLD